MTEGCPTKFTVFYHEKEIKTLSQGTIRMEGGSVGGKYGQQSFYSKMYVGSSHLTKNVILFANRTDLQKRIIEEFLNIFRCFNATDLRNQKRF